MIEYYETAILLPFLVKCHRRFDMEPTEGALATPAKAFHKKSLQLKGAGPSNGEVLTKGTWVY